MESSAGYGFLSDIDIKRYLKDGSNGVQGVQTRLKRKDRFESK